MDIEQRITKLEAAVALLSSHVKWLMANAATLSPDQDEPEYDRDLYQKQPKSEIRNAMEGERLKVRHEMAKGVAEIVTNAGITIDDLSKFGGLDKRTWKDLFNCAKAEYDYENLAAARQADDKYRSGISNLATSMKGVFVLREALRSLPMRNFSEEEFNKRKKAYQACEEMLEGRSDRCDGWKSSYRFAKLFAQEQGYLGA